MSLGHTHEAVRYTSAADVYSFGVLLWTLLTRQQPFAHITNVYAIPSQVVAGVRPAIPAEMPPLVASLVVACWAADPAARPTFADVEVRVVVVVMVVVVVVTRGGGTCPLARGYWPPTRGVSSVLRAPGACSHLVWLRAFCLPRGTRHAARARLHVLVLHGRAGVGTFRTHCCIRGCCPLRRPTCRPSQRRW